MKGGGIKACGKGYKERGAGDKNRGAGLSPASVRVCKEKNQYTARRLTQLRAN